MDQKIKQALRDIVGPDNFTDKVIDLVSYASDASEHRGRPDAAAWPTSTQQVSEILKLANQERFPVIPRGAGTGLSGLAVPDRGGLVLDMSRMNRILKISIEDRVAVVEPGVVYADLQKALEPLGFFYPPDPASGKVCTLGGNVATNAGGVKGAKYGTTKDYVLSLEVVLADGRILHTGSQCIKSVSGYDMTHLFVGSEGTLGVVTQIALKINPKPPCTATALATFESLEDAGRVVSRVLKAGVLPSVLEIMDRLTLEAINQHTDLDLPEVGAMLLAETDGFSMEEAKQQLAKIIEVFKACNAVSVREASSAEEAQALWTARKSSYPVHARLNYNLIVEDMAVPISRLGDALAVISEIGRKYNVDMPVVGHVGDGNLHPSISFDGSNADEAERVHQAAAELFERIIALGGTLTGEHGIGLAKAPYMELEHDPVSMGVMADLKRMLDPNNILNPGKMALPG
ncbi:MAG: FAD-linked oxidase C-terminal domain-containing protein [Thermodesulfobacteriota bacterium]